MNQHTATFGNYSAANALPEERANFIRKTYLHLAAAIAAFIGIETMLVNSDAGMMIAQTMLGGRFSWFIVLALFMGVSMLANWWANSQTSKAMQYLGLGLYVVTQAVVTLPLLFIAAYSSGNGFAMIEQAGIVTLGLFLGITAVVFLTRTDFSFLAPVLMVGGFVALGFIAAGLIFGFNLGSIFAFAMVAFAGGSILYSTSNVLHHYRPDQHVAASLTLFAGIALLFWYILRIFMGSRN